VGPSITSPYACWSPLFGSPSSLRTKCTRDSTHSDREPPAFPPRRALSRIDLRSESPLETIARLLLLDDGLPYPELQLPFRSPTVVGRIDLAYPAALLGVRDGHYSGLAIETDGREPHLREAMFHHDRVRQTALEEERFLVRRFTDPHLRQQPAYVVATVRRAMARVRSANDH
jgi:hypothetical protein